VTKATERKTEKCYKIKEVLLCFKALARLLVRDKRHRRKIGTLTHGTA
jgi:hypothetical protein